MRKLGYNYEPRDTYPLNTGLQASQAPCISGFGCIEVAVYIIDLSLNRRISVYEYEISRQTHPKFRQYLANLFSYFVDLFLHRIFFRGV
jgi:hypothetical protein